MGYREAYEFISSLKRFGGGRGLGAIGQSLASLQNPQYDFPSLHVAGTNGKGSVSAILESVLRQSGKKVGLFTSPHILRINERIRIDGKEIGDDLFASLVFDLAGIIRRDGLTYFEALTLIAFKAFSDHGIDLGVIEVGLGGRLDATNLVRPVVTVITNIDFDHTAYLGSDLRSIALEKLGILKESVPLVTGIEGTELRDVFEEAAARAGVPVHFLDEEVRFEATHLSPDGTTFSYRSPDCSMSNLRLPLTGRHQARNAALAVRALECMDPRIGSDTDLLGRGLREVRLDGRFQLVRREPCPVVLDVFHNPHGAKAVLETFSELFDGRRRHLVIGMARDKDVEKIAELFAPQFREAITVKPVFWSQDREVGPADLAPVFRRVGMHAVPARSMKHALRIAGSRIGPGDVMLVGGSFRTVAAALSVLNDL